MPSRRTSSGDAAEQDDSLVVHPATQGAGDAPEDDSPVMSDSDEEAQADSQGFWEAEAILDETRTQYLISWKGTDDDGNNWKPTWEPKDNANAELVKSWKEHGRAQKKQAKQRQAEERQKKKQAKKVAKDARKKRSSTSASSTRDSPALIGKSPTVSVEVEVPAAPRTNNKRKVVVPESEGSQEPSQPVNKKAREDKPASPQKKQKKRVAFDLVLSDDEEDVLAQVESVVAAAEPAVEIEQEVEVVQSSGSTAASVIPDSQAAPLLADVAKAAPAPSPGPPAPPPPASSNERATQASMHSPATSHSDFEGHPHDGHDDVPIFDPLQHNDHDRASSSEPEPRPRFGPVPVPAVSAFQVAESILIRSSQVDPIEDPDSSPRRSPVRRSHSYQSPRHGSPRTRPTKTRLELVSAEDDEIASPVSSFELEVLSAAAASYVSLPMDAAAAPVIPIASTSGVRSRSRPAVTAQAIKRPLVRAPAASADVDAGTGVAARAAIRSPSPEGEDFDFDGDDRQQEFFDEIFDYDRGVALSQQLPEDSTDQGKAAGEAQDAGEGYPSNGYNPYGASGSGSNGQSAQQGQQQQQQYAAPAGYGYPSAPAIPGGYGFGSAPGYPGGGHPPVLPSPFGHPHAHQQPQKREYDDGADAANKKARTEPTPQPVTYPAAAHTHSPYSAMPHSLTPNPGSLAAITSPFNATHQQHQHQHQAYAYPGSYAPQPASRAPAVTVQAPSPSVASAAVASPLARVQSQDPYAQARAGSHPASPAISALVSPALSAAASAAHRSPSPLPPAAAPAVAPAAPLIPAAPASPSLIAASQGSFISRNSSPAPGPGKTEEVIALVRTSPHIQEADGTKVEVEKFLRDPEAYSANPNAPLMRTEFWAFALRHVQVDAVEKVDFIILHTHQHKFQLKRAVAGKVPVEFARSLSHPLARPRGFTPAVEGAPTSSPVRAAPPPPAPATMTREQLEQEVERLRQQSQAQETELATLRPVAAEAAKLKTDVQTLTKTNKSLVASRESAQQDLSYMQAQYQAASGAAVERANEARVAEAEAAKLRGLLDTGLKQKELVYAGQIKAVKTEYARLKAQMKHYQAESRRTEERGFREKAAKWDEHVARLAQDQEDAARKAQGLPVEVDSGDEEDVKLDGGDDEEDKEPSTIDPSVASIGASQLPSQVPAGAIGLIGAPDVAQPFPAVVNAPMPPSSAPSTFDSTIHAAEDFRCEWRTGTESQAQPCGATKASKESLQEHIVAEHLAQ
ncbi:hypothetical protein JCM10450v2_004848 [Rhodotorula kratochvilovae]